MPGLANIGFLIVLMAGLFFLLCVLIFTFRRIWSARLALVLVSPCSPTFTTTRC